MQQYRKNLGKVSLTAEGAWARTKDYEILSIVYDENTNHGFISRRDVPEGVDLYNKEYWMPFNVSGYADNNIIILSQKTSESAIKSYTLEEAIKSIASVGRRPGAILGFYNENTDRLDIGGRWELWQYNGVDVADWENVNSWDSIYYNYNKFVGWYRNEDSLKKYIPFPEVGCYAYVGSDLNEAVIYRCDRKYAWTNTTEHVWNYFKVIVGGNVTVGENGNWFNNGVDTNIPASVKGENGKTPIIRNNDNVLEVSYDNVNWEPISDEVAVWARVNNNKLEITKHKVGGWEIVSDYIAAWFRWQSQGGQQANSTGKIQITRDGITWTDLSGEFVNNLRISRYIGADESLPTSGIAEGTIYAKGPYYEDDDTLHEYPAYRIWVYAWKGNTLAWQDNGEFQSIAAGIVQETGDSETEVMSQKATTEKLTELASQVIELSSDRIALISGIFVNRNGIIENDSFSCTDYISVKEKDTIKCYNTISEIHSIAPSIVLFDENKQYIDSIKYKELGLFNLSINNGVSYVRLNVYNNYKKDFFVYISSVERLEENLQNNDKSISDLKDWHNNINANLGFSMFKLSDDSFTKGEYRNTAGIISTLSSYIRTIPIYVTQGTRVIFTNSITVTPIVSVVSEVDSEGNYLATILGGVNNTTGVLIEKDCYIEISTPSSGKNYLFINKSETINSINKSIYKNKESANMALVQSYESKDLQNKSNLVIGNGGTIISVTAPAYQIAYYISNEDNSNIKVEFLRNNTYSYCGNTCIANSIDDILEGNVLKFIHKFEYEKRETIDIVLNKGEVLAVSCLFGSTPDEIKCYVYNKNRIDNIEKRIDLLEEFIPSTLPTEYIGGDCSAFSKVLCIGDSLTRGVFNYDEIEGNTFTANKEYSYPSNFSRISGCETINMGFGGITSYGWYSSYKDDERVLGNDCCIIALGVNDSVDTLETRSRDAFINIISLVKEKNKQIKIFLSGIINGKSYNATNELSNYAIKDKFIRDLYDELYADDEQVFFLDMVKYGHLQSLESIPSSTYPLDNYNMGHLSAYGYWRLAKDFYNYISYIMANDKNNVFRNIQFTGTDFYFKIPYSPK